MTEQVAWGSQSRSTRERATRLAHARDTHDLTKGKKTVAKEKGLKVVARNRKAYHDYLIEDTFEAGMVLSGTEVKALRAGRASLVDGYASVREGEIWLEGVHIPEYTEATWNNHTPRRRRKLLLNKSEIVKLVQKDKESGYTIVPLSMYFKDGYAKVEIALAKGKRTYDKRQTLRAQQDEREAQRAVSARRGR
jgi:SsrA-binding protein